MLDDTVDSMDWIEIQSRRRALGLGQDRLGNTWVHPQAAISMWESGKRSPRYPDGVCADIAKLEAIRDRFVDTMSGRVGSESGQLLVAYTSDDELWFAQPSMVGIPVEVWQVACALAASRAEKRPAIVVDERVTNLHQKTGD